MLLTMAGIRVEILSQFWQFFVAWLIQFRLLERLLHPQATGTLYHWTNFLLGRIFQASYFRSSKLTHFHMYITKIACKFYFKKIRKCVNLPGYQWLVGTNRVQCTKTFLFSNCITNLAFRDSVRGPQVSFYTSQSFCLIQKEIIKCVSLTHCIVPCAEIENRFIFFRRGIIICPKIFHQLPQSYKWNQTARILYPQARSRK